MEGDSAPAVPEKRANKANISEIANKEFRHQQYIKLRREKKKDKKKRRDVRKKEAEALGEDAPPKLVPKTIESMREADETTVKVGDVPEVEQDEEVNWDIANDEFKDYFGKSYEPKVLITSADNPHSVSAISSQNVCYDKIPCVFAENNQVCQRANEDHSEFFAIVAQKHLNEKDG